MLDNVFDTLSENEDFVAHINAELARLFGQDAVAAGRKADGTIMLGEFRHEAGSLVLDEVAVVRRIDDLLDAMLRSRAGVPEALRREALTHLANGAVI